MNSLGIYFGPKLISIIESKGKVLLNKAVISQASISAGELEDKVPSEVKIVALFKDELRKNNIEGNEASLVLSGRDLVIRTFEMPVVPPGELENAVKFEAKKYIPFRIEDLITDFQLHYDKSNRKNIVLFVGIKKDIIEKYFSVLNQLDIKPVAVEYSAFSVLRLLSLSRLSDKGIISVIGVDFKEEDEVNFSVLENGFPLFSRDITLASGPDELAGAREKSEGILFEKLKTEIRVSLDYYHRKFPSKKISRVYIVSSQEYRSEMGLFAKEMGLGVQFVESEKLLGKTVPFSLSVVKGYSVSLSKTVRGRLKINLLAAKEKMKKKEGAAPAPISLESMPSLLSGLQVYPRAVILGVLICLVTFGYGIMNKLPLNKELTEITGLRPQVEGVNAGLSNEELAKIDSEYKRKVDIFDNLFKSQIYLTRLLETIAKVKPEGIWLNEMGFKSEENKVYLVLSGMAYLNDSDQEFALVNKFLSNLKQNSTVTKYFKDLNVESLDHKTFKRMPVTTFSISCRTTKRERE